MADTLIPKAKLNDVQLDGKAVLHAAYGGQCVTLSPLQNHHEFYDQVRKLNAMVNRIVEVRRDHLRAQENWGGS